MGLKGSDIWLKDEICVSLYILSSLAGILQLPTPPSSELTHSVFISVQLASCHHQLHRASP